MKRPLNANETMVLEQWKRSKDAHPDPAAIREKTGLDTRKMNQAFYSLVELGRIDVYPLEPAESLYLGAAIALSKTGVYPSHRRVCLRAGTRKNGAADMVASIKMKGLWPASHKPTGKKPKISPAPVPRPRMAQKSKPVPKDVAELLPRSTPLIAKAVYRLAWKLCPNGGSFDYKAMLERSALNQHDTWAGYHWLVSRGLWMWKHVGGVWRTWKPMTGAETRMYRVSMIPA